MKLCPTCLRRYSDDTLNFCLEDGSQLSDVAHGADDTLTLDAGEPPPTEILDPALAPTLGTQQKPHTTVRQEARATRRDEFQNLAAATPPARNTTSVVALTVVATILLLALGGLGAWLLLRNNGAAETPQDNGNNGPVVLNTPDLKNVNASTPGVVTPTPTQTPTSTPQTTPTPQINDTSATRAEVSSALEGWRRTMNGDVDAHMAYYADVLHTYYNARNVNVSRVRDNVANAFTTYDTFDVRITNLQIEVDPSGQSAVATFDKTFEFKNDRKTFAASGLNRFWFEKIGGRWRITGEKDLKTYYVNK